jgi:hypothetical protein
MDPMIALRLGPAAESRAVLLILVPKTIGYKDTNEAEISNMGIIQSCVTF